MSKWWLVVGGWWLVGAAFGQDARQIVAESQKRGQSKSQQYEGTLEVIGPSNKSSLKRWSFERIGSGGTAKTILRFLAPAEVKGVAVLIIEHPDRPSDQWIWTPALDRERRVAVQNRATRFFGTDFSFEDLEERDVDQYDYKLLGETTFDGQRCWKIESRPKPDAPSQYTSSLLLIRKDVSVVVQIENYVKDRMVRRIHSTDLEKQDGIWAARTVEVFDAARGSRTVLKFQKVRYNLPIPENDFTVGALRHH